MFDFKNEMKKAFLAGAVGDRWSTLGERAQEDFLEDFEIWYETQHYSEPPC